MARLEHPNILQQFGMDFSRSILVTEFVQKIVQLSDVPKELSTTHVNSWIAKYCLRCHPFSFFISVQI